MKKVFVINIILCVLYIFATFQKITIKNLLYDRWLKFNVNEPD